MKELTIEEKAKRYDEAITKGKQILNIPYTAHWDTMKEVVEHLFPELKESEDERMRNAAIDACKYMVDNFENSTKQYEDAIAWLEKQGEQKSAEWSEEDASTLNRISSILVDASEVKNWWKEDRLIERDEMIRLTDFLKSLRPQNRWRPSDKQLEAVRIAAEIGTANDSWAMGILKGMYQDLKKLREE